ncbi:MAG: hypothetical protein GF331_19980 [Chitinivibrionales bacterium]|nr:hypothetical protein [Chitinivibrionales bacterium]
MRMLHGFVIAACLVTQSAGQEICNSSGAWCTFLKQQDSLGLAAGNAGDYYHNADSLHANAGNSTCPQVTLLPVTRGTVYGTDSTKVVVGNASLAYTTLPGAVSLVRYGLLNQSGANNVYRQYTHNNAYWYPEHRDHDYDRDGDRYHAMTPCVSNSQGSSGSELDEVRKFLWTLAAFRPQTKDVLRDANLLMPTLQMIMRRTRAVDDEEYLSGAVHWNAFDNADNALAMVELANEMLPDNVPPMIRLRVIDDDYESAPRELSFGQNTLQRWYDTPVSICRIRRDFQYTHEVIVSADSSYDVNGRPLTYEWRVIRGDPELVRITPLTPGNQTVRIELDQWNGDTIPGTAVFSSLQVVAAFAHNGVYYSAPAFVTSFQAPNQVRAYDTARGAPIEVVYQDYHLLESLDLNRSWDRDTFSLWDGTPVVSGWTRHGGGDTWEFSANGYLVGERNASGQVTRAQQVYYSSRDTLSRRRMVWRTSGSMEDFDGASPQAPSGVTVANQPNGAALVSWGDATDRTIAPAAASGVAGYRVEVSTSSSFASIVKRWNCRDVGDTTECLVDGLAARTRHYVRVRAYDANFNLSDPSVARSFTTAAGVVAWRSSRGRMLFVRAAATGGGRVRFGGLPAGATVVMVDLRGRCVARARVTDVTPVTLPADGCALAAGVYRYRIEAPGSVTVQGAVRVLGRR